MLENSLAYHSVPYINDLKEDFHKLKKSTWGYDLEAHKKKAEVAEDVIGDILPVRVFSQSPYGSLATGLRVL